MRLRERPGGPLERARAFHVFPGELAEFGVVEFQELRVAQGQGDGLAAIERRPKVEIHHAQRPRPRREQTVQRVTIRRFAQGERTEDDGVRRLQTKERPGQHDTIPGDGADNAVGGDTVGIERGTDDAGRQVAPTGNETNVEAPAAQPAARFLAEKIAADTADRHRMHALP